MRSRIGIVGTGWVGASVAISLLHAGIARAAGVIRAAAKEIGL